LSGSLGGSAHRDATRTGQALGAVRLHLARTGSGLWLGGSAGGTWDGEAWRSVRQAEVGGWLQAAGTSALLTITPTLVEDTIEYADATISLAWQSHSLEVSAFAGYRLGDRLAALGGTNKSWGGLSLVAWLTPWAGLVAGAGTYPVDLTQGFPGGQYFTVGARFRAPVRPRPGLAPVQGAAASSVEPASGNILVFETRPAGDGLTTLRLRVTRATRVEVSADFTDWQAVAMRAKPDGWWSVTLPIEPGAHQLNVRVDGGSWLVPPGLPQVADEFGGRVGILVVPR
jgi:hypothetical protein